MNDIDLSNGEFLSFGGNKYIVSLPRVKHEQLYGFQKKMTEAFPDLYLIFTNTPIEKISLEDFLNSRCGGLLTMRDEAGNFVAVSVVDSQIDDMTGRLQIDLCHFSCDDHDKLKMYDTWEFNGMKLHYNRYDVPYFEFDILNDQELTREE